MSKGRPLNFGPSPGNILATQPMEVLSMDFVMPLPASKTGNTAFLLFQDTLSNFVMCKAMKVVAAQDVAEATKK